MNTYLTNLTPYSTYMPYLPYGPDSPYGKDGKDVRTTIRNRVGKNSGEQVRCDSRCYDEIINITVIKYLGSSMGISAVVVPSRRQTRFGDFFHEGF